MLEASVSQSEIKLRDISDFANRRSSNTRCIAECDESQLARFSEEEATEWERHRRWKFRCRFRQATFETVERFINAEPQPYTCRFEAPMNLLAGDELNRLRLKRYLPSNRVVLEDGGVTIVPLYWAIVAPTTDLGGAINVKASHQRHLLRRLVGIRDEGERKRLAVIWSQWGLRPFTDRTKVEDIRQCLSILERMPVAKWL